MKIEVINSLDRKLATIIGYEPYYTTNRITLEYEDGTKKSNVLYSESYFLCLRTTENLKALARLSEIDCQIKRLREEGYELTENMEKIINADKFKSMIVDIDLS